MLPLILLYKINITNSIQNTIRNNYSCEKQIFLGSSHGRDAFKADIIKNYYNLSNTGFTLEESYYELLEVLSRCEINNVVISFSVFSLSKTSSKPVETNIKFKEQV